MASGLQKRIKQSKFSSVQQEALLSLLVAAGHIRTQLDHVCADHSVTHGQYNVLRILRGAYPDGYPRCEIIDRMLEAAPDVTRLIDRLVKMGLVERTRSMEDRRLSIARITKRGLELLEEMAPHIESVSTSLADRMSDEDCRLFTELCEHIYEENLEPA